MNREIGYLEASTAPRELLVVSRIRGQWIHWDGPPGRICGETNCRLCRDGWRPEKRWILRLESAEHFEYLLQARERHTPVLDQLEAMQQRGRTGVVEVYRAGTARNSPIQIRTLREVAYPELYEILPLELKTWRAPVLVTAEAEPNGWHSAPSELRMDSEADRLQATRDALRAKHAASDL